jgi:hypothetical protein
MNPTGLYVHMFEGKRGKDCISKTTDILIKKKQKFLLLILRKEKTLIVSLTLRIHIFSVLQNDNVVNVFILNKENMTVLYVYRYTHTP